MKIEKTAVTGFIPAIQGMRNSFNSHDKSDSIFYDYYSGIVANDIFVFDKILIGPRDMQLAMNLVKAGEPHCKFRRMIIVWVDITAPLLWWKQMDTYKVGTTANSDSTMHNVCDRDFTPADFGCHGDSDKVLWIDIIDKLNEYRRLYIECKSNGDMDEAAKWQRLIYELMPCSYHQKRTLCLNYSVLASIYQQRRSHKLGEWHKVCQWIETLPYSELITGRTKDDQ